MWIVMFIGSEPFFLDEASWELRMQLVPTLPRWLLETKVEDGFEQTPKFSFKLFSSIQVYCYNERSVDLFGILPSRYRVWVDFRC
jgi:hypothetical protein